MPRNRRIGGETVKSSPTVGEALTCRPTNTIELDIKDGRVVVIHVPPGEQPLRLSPLGARLLSDLRQRLVDEGFYGDHEHRQLERLKAQMLAGMTWDEFDAEVRRRFGPWSKPERDPKGRIVWTRREVNELGPVIRGAVVGDAGTVVG